MADPLLDFNTTAQFIGTIRVDGVPCELRSPEWLSLTQYHQFRRSLQRISELNAKDELSDRDVIEYKSLLDRQVRIVLEARDDIYARLSDLQRIEIVDCFLQLPGASLAASALPSAPMEPPAAPPTGDTISHASPASTAATPSAG